MLSGSCGENVSFELNASGVLTITGTGPMTDYYSNTFPWFEKRNDVKKVIVGEGVTSLGNYAFYQCNNLVSVSLPSTITRIGDYTFYYCYTRPSRGSAITHSITATAW